MEKNYPNFGTPTKEGLEFCLSRGGNTTCSQKVIRMSKASSKVVPNYKKGTLALIPACIFILITFFFSSCKGASKHDDSEQESNSLSEQFKECPDCHGSGVCARCGGTGETVIHIGGVPFKDGCASCYPGTGVCSFCNGTGEIRKNGNFSPL